MPGMEEAPFSLTPDILHLRDSTHLSPPLQSHYTVTVQTISALLSAVPSLAKPLSTLSQNDLPKVIL